MAPHREHTDDSVGFEHFVDQAMLKVDSPRVAAMEISDELLVWRRIAERVLLQHFEQPLCGGLQPATCQLLRVFSGAGGECQLALQDLKNSCPMWELPEPCRPVAEMAPSADG